MKKAMIFDMDGTLFQTNKILQTSLEDTFEMLRELELWRGETPLEMYREIMGVPLSVVWETLLPQHQSPIHIKANEVFHEKLIKNIKAGKGDLYPHAKELLAYLSNRGYPIFVASNGCPHYLESIISYYQLDKWISKCYSIQEIESKEKGDLIRKVKNDNQLMYGAVVGDRLSDFQGAEMNDLLSIGCKFDFSKMEELAQADVVVNDLMEIREFLELIKER
ncbi:HAD hydrolase-like protein [Rossellomorea aquimaris]|uniref:HAD hydrolase-like protein n=1 Tax=Rossellomorea aquimaris TaxID=189382 RepID=UPI0007D0766C|nr:HAD hydrolase-like protein [Rossellomorea aquimaris]